MKTKFTFFLLAFTFVFSVSAQEAITVQSEMMQGPIYVPSIAEQIQNGTFIRANDNPDTMGHPKMRLGNNVVPGKGLPVEGQVDPLLVLQQNTELRRNRAPIQTFETTTSTATPSDPTGAVGPNHYVAAWNTSFRIFDKSGNPLTAAASLATIFPGNAIGDPIVFYDAAADRFVITEFDNSPNGFNVAVAQGANPVTSGWHVYTTGFGTGSFPDYTKFSVWADSYVVTANIGSSNRVFAVERNEMLNGDPAQFVAMPLPGIVTSGFYSPQAFHTTDAALAPIGTPCPIVYLQDDAWGGVTTDHLKVWSADIDWGAGTGTMSAAQVINTTTDFISVFDGGSFSNLPQPGGPDIDAMQATIMNQAQYRRFGGHNSAVFNFVVDTDPGGGELAGIRWFELRQTSDGQPWSINMEGTYTSPVGGKHAFAGSMAMNSAGDIGLGYSTVSTSEMVAIYYTGRFSTDPPGVMTVAEDLIAQSTANNNNLRYADYTHLTVDPVDDTFWHVSEYFNTNRRDIVGQFMLAPPMANDIGALSIDQPNSGTLTNAEDIVITIRNFGSNNITNPEVQYQIDGGTPVVENFAGTINAGTNAQFTFAQTADLSAPGSYVIDAKTNLAGDTNTGNDSATKTVTNGIVYCAPSMDCSFGDGFTLVSLEQINNPSGCEGYADFTNLVANLQQGVTYDLTVTTGYGDQNVKVWIDFNDDGTFDNSEVVVPNFVIAPGQMAGSFTETVDLTIPAGATVGMHRLRAKSNWQAPVPNDACTTTTYGETEDYTANIGLLGVEDFSITNAELVIVNKENNQFEISLVTNFDGVASITVYDLLGRTLAFNNLLKEGASYNYDLDMSYVSSGVYMIKVGDQRSNTYKTAKIIVK
ncbi:MAG: T9SS type A sorting domain-containing protein [Flavobacteriaceae bacterium]|nr:T9SS type A sorting domain-containing protein [Flavobacteriaceae bacterium]